MYQAVPQVIKEEGKSTMFRFPNDPEILRRWLRHIHRDIEMTSSTRVCEFHFHADDFVNESTDTNTSRKSSREQPLAYKKLKPTAIPRIHENLPVYLTSPSAPDRPANASCESRLAAENQRLSEKICLMEQSDRIESMDDLQSGIFYNFFTPISGFETMLKDNTDVIIFVHINNECVVPQIDCA